MRSQAWIFLAVALVLLPGAQRSLAIDLPEMRSYQPRSGLQFGFRPTPPVQRGARTTRPQVIMPKRVAPMIGYGSPPHLSLGYSYCADRPDGTLEPLTGPYDAKPIPRTQCQ